MLTQHFRIIQHLPQVSKSIQDSKDLSQIPHFSKIQQSSLDHEPVRGPIVALKPMKDPRCSPTETTTTYY